MKTIWILLVEDQEEHEDPMPFATKYKAWKYVSQCYDTKLQKNDISDINGWHYTDENIIVSLQQYTIQQ